MDEDLGAAARALDLSQIGLALSGIGVSVRLLDTDDGVPLTSLLVAAGEDYAGRERHLSASFVPGLQDFEAVALLQLYSVVPGDVHDASVSDLLAFLSEVNQLTAIGHFSLGDDGVVVRHVNAVPVTESLSERAVVELFGLFVLTLDVFGSGVARLAAAETDLDGARASVSDPG